MQRFHFGYSKVRRSSGVGGDKKWRCKGRGNICSGRVFLEGCCFSQHSSCSSDSESYTVQPHVDPTTFHMDLTLKSTCFRVFKPWRVSLFHCIQSTVRDSCLMSSWWASATCPASVSMVRKHSSYFLLVTACLGVDKKKSGTIFCVWLSVHLFYFVSYPATYQVFSQLGSSFLALVQSPIQLNRSWNSPSGFRREKNVTSKYSWSGQTRSDREHAVLAVRLVSRDVNRERCRHCNSSGFIRPGQFSSLYEEYGRAPKVFLYLRPALAKV